MRDTREAVADLFGPEIGPLKIERCKTSLRFSLGQSPVGSAPVAVRFAEGEGYTVRAAAVSGFALPSADALFSVRVGVAGLTGAEILTGDELPGADRQALTVGGLRNAAKLAMALRAAASALEALGADIMSGAVERALLPDTKHKARPAPAPAPCPEASANDMISMAEAVRLSGLSRQSLWVAWKRKKQLEPPKPVRGRPQWPRQVFYEFMNSRRLSAQRT